MPPLSYALRAREDIRRLFRFLAIYDTDAAQRAVAAIRKGLHTLRRHPEAGRPVPDATDGCREWCIPFGNAGYVALYCFDARAVYILAIKHQREMEYDEKPLLQ